MPTSKKLAAKGKPKKAAAPVADALIDGLTPKEHQFVDFYLGEANLNGAKAAKMAGYSEGSGIYTAASRLLRNVNIRSAINKHLTEATMSAKEVLMRLTRHAEADIGDLLLDNGEFDFEEARERGLTDLIKELQVTERWIPNGDSEPEKERTYKVKLHDAQAAMAHLGKYHKLFTDKTELTGKDGGAIMVMDPEQSIASFMADAAKKGEPCSREQAIDMLRKVGVPIPEGVK